jgi:cobalt-zinc-cadmium efflux system membrane fusion protein
MDNSKYYVVVKKGGKLLVQEVNVIKRNEDKAYISGLAVGDEVVTSSQLFLYQALTSN